MKVIGDTNRVIVGIEKQLLHLVAETSKSKPGSTERQQGLTLIVRLIVKSGKLWKEDSPCYEDALQQTWIYFCRNLCEATTADKYDPNRGSVITWLNAYLKRRLQDYRLQIQAMQIQTATKKIFVAGEMMDLMETLKAPPEIPPILESTRKWIQTDPDGELHCIHIQGCPKVTCQALLLQRLPPETDWETIADRFGLSVSTLSSFYQRQCLPRLRQFGKSEGYL